MSNEQRKQQIWNEACHRYADSKMRNAFVTAAEWADQHPHWIPVEEQLPPPYCSNGSISDFVLTYNGYDVVKGYYDFMQNNWHNENYKVMEFDVTHWMEIVPPRKEE